MQNNKAHWVLYTHLFSPDEYECPVCGATTKQQSDVCPCCGSSMSGEKYDPSWVDKAAMMDTILEKNNSYYYKNYL